MPDNFDVSRTFAYDDSSSPIRGTQDPSYRDDWDAAYRARSQGSTRGISWVNQANRQSDDTPSVNWSRDNQGSQSSGSPGRRLARELTTMFPNNASVLAIQEHLQLGAGADGRLNRDELTETVYVSRSQAERIIDNMEGEDANSVSVADMLALLEPFSDGGQPPLVSNRGIDDWITEMMGGRNNFFAWAGEDGQMNSSQFWDLVQALMADYEGEHEVNINRALSDRIFRRVAGSDAKIDPNEFAGVIAELDDDDKFDWETAQEKVATFALQLGPANGNRSTSGGPGNTFTTEFAGDTNDYVPGQRI